MMRVAWAAAVAAAAAGCGGGPATAPVRGTVTYRDKPLPVGRVFFHGPGNHTVASDIAADGTYALTAAVGESAVTVESNEPGKVVAVIDGWEKRALGRGLIPEKYRTTARSGLRAAVGPGGTTYDIVLTD